MPSITVHDDFSVTVLSDDETQKISLLYNPETRQPFESEEAATAYANKAIDSGKYWIPAVDPVVDAPMIVSAFDFITYHITPQERIAMRTSPDLAIQDGVAIIMDPRLETVDLKSNMLVDLVGYASTAVTPPIFTAERAEEILSGKRPA